VVGRREQPGCAGRSRQGHTSTSGQSRDRKPVLNLKDLDLNLLRTLDALIEER
jgi:hypothetical protein